MLSSGSPKWLMQKSFFFLVTVQLYPGISLVTYYSLITITRLYTVTCVTQTLINVCKVISYFLSCALCLSVQMRQDQAQWRASMTLWTLTLCLRRPRGVYTADMPYWQLSNPLSWATSRPQPRLHLMFTYLNTEMGKKIGPFYWGRSAAEAWGR